MNRPDCKHPSAFCMMRYQSKDRTIEELVWNSRDMEVPQTINAQDVKAELVHTDAHRDEFKPYFLPRVGTRAFIDPVTERAEASAAATYAEHYADKDFVQQFGEERTPAIAKLVEQQLAKSAKEGAVKPGPVLVTVTPELLVKLEKRLPARAPQRRGGGA